MSTFEGNAPYYNISDAKCRSYRTNICGEFWIFEQSYNTFCVRFWPNGLFAGRGIEKEFIHGLRTFEDAQECTDALKARTIAQFNRNKA